MNSITIADLNNHLYRQLRSDYSSDIFPKSACKASFLGDGDTFFSVEQIASFAKEFAPQCQKIAQKLKKSTLEATCRAIHQFLYWHFQYTADSSSQQLRSPACSWASRKEGIDCKSYSILAGSILHQMGYNFYIRQVKQLGMTPNEFSHVYVVVPKNQKTNDLGSGYYTIDGTVLSEKESIYITEKSDLLVMKHIGLRGAGLLEPTLTITTYNQGGLYAETPPKKSVDDWINFGFENAGRVGNLIAQYKAIFGANNSGRDDREYYEAKVREAAQQNNAQFAQFLELMRQQQQAQQVQPEKTDYTPYIIAGGGLFVVMMFMMMMTMNGNNNNKK